MISSASEKNLQQFFGYVKDFKDKSFNKIEFVDKLEVTRDNDELVQIRRNGIVFSEVYFRFAGTSASKIEGLHINVAFCDELKMTSKNAFQVSILPTANGRLGIIFGFSSTDEFITYFQELCEQNIEKEKIDGIKRHYMVNVWDLVRERPSYAIAVKRAEQTLGRNSIAFRTQYLCEFIGRKPSSFFSIEIMRDLGVMTEEFDDYEKYIFNPKYTIIAGFDIAMSTNNSVFTIKALENGFGITRKTKLIAQYVLNKTRNVEAENIRKQLREIVFMIKKYGIQAILMDGTGVGKNASIYLKELLYEEDIEDLDFNKIVEINLGHENRTKVLTNYYTRLNSGLEYIWKLPSHINDNDSLKRYYNNYHDYFESEAEIVRFYYEHIKFNKDESNATNGTQSNVFKQTEEYKLQDDTIFASALCSHLVTLFPDIQSNIDFNNIKARFYDETNYSNYGV